MEKISFILPCYGSEKTLGLVVEEIIAVIGQKKEYDYEIIAVNDCSPDGVWEVIKTLTANNSRIKGIDFAKNRNRPGAVMAGLANSTGDFCVVMDDDGQCPMPELWKLIQPLYEGYDVSIASYPERKQSKFKNIGTAVNKLMSEFIIGRPKNLQFTNFMAMKRFVADKLTEYTNPYPYLTGLLLRTTQHIANVPMEQRARLEGNTTFTFKKMVSLWMNGFTAFSIKPLRVADIIGAVSALIGFIYAIVIVVRKLLEPNIAVGYSSLMAAILVIGGIIMILLGLIGEYIGRIYMCINNSPQYVIREKINFDSKEN
ncbi:MAG: glycosyltransferase [Ruminiclostridium sp.]